MADPIARQLDSIQSMLTRGQRNLRMERHSLILWGLAGAGLFMASDLLFTAELSAAELPALERDPRVAAVGPPRVVHVADAG